MPYTISIHLLDKLQFPEFHTPSKGSDRSGGTQWCSVFLDTKVSHWVRALPAELKFTEAGKKRKNTRLEDKKPQISPEQFVKNDNCILWTGVV